MFGHQQDDNQQHDATAPVVNDVSAFPPQDDINPAVSSTVGAALPDTDAGNFEAAPAPAAESFAPAATDHDDLATIKQAALQELSPLVGHLEQSPEEKFRTTMMMIQAADDQSLIKVAYEAAQQIGDEKAKAQALLDVVNEINYFTQQHAA